MPSFPIFSLFAPWIVSFCLFIFHHYHFHHIYFFISSVFSSLLISSISWEYFSPLHAWTFLTPSLLYHQLSSLLSLIPLFPCFICSIYVYVFFTLCSPHLIPLFSTNILLYSNLLVSTSVSSVPLFPTSWLFSFSLSSFVPPFILSFFLCSVLHYLTPSSCPFLFRPFLFFFLFFCPVFLMGCQSSLCSPYDIIQCHLQPVCNTVQVLVALDTTSLDRKQEEEISAPNLAYFRGSETPSLVSVTTQTPPPTWQMWDLIGSSLLHILCLVLLFAAYTWSELT